MYWVPHSVQLPSSNTLHHSRSDELWENFKTMMDFAKECMRKNICFSIWIGMSAINFDKLGTPAIELFTVSSYRMVKFNLYILKQWILFLARSDWPLNLRISSTISHPVPPGERRQTRESYGQNGFPVCSRNKQRN